MKLDNLNSLSRVFLSELERCVANGMFFARQTDHLIVTIPAKSPEVGDLTVHLDGDEVIVNVGPHYHTHFETYTIEAETPEARELEAAKDAVRFIRDVLDEKVRFRGQFAHGRCLNFSSWYPEKSEGIRRLLGADEVIDYAWSGRV